MIPVAPVSSLDPGPFAGRITGVLFDIDETLVDLYRAMADAMIFASEGLLPDFTAADWEDFAAVYMADPLEYYDRYVAGEFTFVQQRGLRARVVFEKLGFQEFTDAVEQRWISDFETAQPQSIQAFADVVPLLDALDAAGIPYGAVSNNVHDYQRTKLDVAGLVRIGVLVGIDTVNVSKPDPAIFLEGCRQLGTVPEETLYVGDNFMVDGVGAANAGMHSVWLNRGGKVVPVVSEGDASVAAELRVVTGLDQVHSLLGLHTHAAQM